MTTLTLVANEAQARMDIVVQNPLGFDSSLVRTDPDGTSTLVRGGQDLTGDIIVWDYECPFGVEVTYSLDDATASGSLNVTSAWLSHPTDASLSCACNVIDDDGWQWTAPGTAFDVIGSQWPVVVHSTRSVHTGTLRLWTTWQARSQLVDLVQSGSPILLRVPPGTFVEDTWLWPMTVRRTKQSPYDPAWVEWQLDYQRCGRPAAAAVTQDPSNSWAAVLLTHATWAALTASHTTWVDLLLDAHPHGWVDSMRHTTTLDGVTLT